MDKLREKDQAVDADGSAQDRRKGRLHIEAADSIRRRILSGDLPPGARLREVQVCKELSMSRTPVREAFRTLAAEGLIDLLPNRSVLVSMLRKTDMADLFVVFADLEALAARLACQHITDAEIKEIGQYLSDMVDRHAAGERGQYLQLNQKIHQRTVEIAGNPILLSLWQTLVPKIERARALPNLNPKRWSDALLEHSKMFTVLAARDGDKLAELTRAHFLTALAHLERKVAAQED
jgi:DNA-binding GntR family transcriptional regulator